MHKTGIPAKNICNFYCFLRVADQFSQSAVVLDRQHLVEVVLLQVHSIMTVMGTKLATNQSVTIESICKNNSNRY